MNRSGKNGPFSCGSSPGAAINAELHDARRAHFRGNYDGRGDYPAPQDAGTVQTVWTLVDVSGNRTSCPANAEVAGEMVLWGGFAVAVQPQRVLSHMLAR